MTIYIDPRAGSEDLIKLPPLDTPGLCIMSKLNSGDVMFSGYGPDGEALTGIELKSLSDLISSIQTGRLQSGQMVKMIKDYASRWILYYGEYRPGENGALQVKLRQWKNYGFGAEPVKYSYLESFLIEAREYGFRIQRVSTKEEAAKWIYVIYKLLSRPWESHRIFETFDKSGRVPFPPIMKLSELEKRMARVVDELCPGIGFRRAVKVARHFKSITHMLLAGVDEWKKIDGIGKVIAKKVNEEIWREK